VPGGPAWSRRRAGRAGPGYAASVVCGGCWDGYRHNLRLGTTVGVIEKLIAGDEKAKLTWDRAKRNPTGRNRYTKPEAEEVKVYNVNLDQKPKE
jgi:hypothetical protein